MREWILSPRAGIAILLGNLISAGLNFAAGNKWMLIINLFVAVLILLTFKGEDN